jgi:hypothetical protein
MTNRQINLLRLVAEAADWLLLAHAQAADTNTAAATHAARLARQIETAITAMDLERELAEAHAARQSALQAAQASGGHVGADSGQTPRSALSGPGNAMPLGHLEQAMCADGAQHALRAAGLAPKDGAE